MSEKCLQELVRRTALAFGWAFYHPFYSRKSAPGWPDCALVRGERLVFAELKTTTGKLSPHQQNWIAALSAVPGVEVYVFRPEHWLSGEIERVLR